MSYEKYLGNDTPIPEGDLRNVYKGLAAFLNQDVHLQRETNYKKLMDRILVQAYKGTSGVLPTPIIPTLSVSTKPASGVEAYNKPFFSAAPLGTSRALPTPNMQTVSAAIKQAGVKPSIQPFSVDPLFRPPAAPLGSAIHASYSANPDDLNVAFHD